MKYVFHPEALTEYADAVKYYSQQRKDIAQAFINAIENTVYRIRENPNRHPILENEVRRCMVKKFPYGVLYSFGKDEELILILAIMHCSREANYWKKRQS